jgi:hypothetical protein
VRACLRLLTLIAVVVLASAAPAVADEESGAGGGGDAYIDGDGNPTVEVVDVETDPGSESSGDGSDCFFRVAIGDDFETGIYDVDGSRSYSETGRWLELVCDGSIVPIDGQGIIPEGGAVDPAQLAADARASVPIEAPPIATSPDADRETYAQVTTWLWVDPSWWKGYSATATAGRVSATVTATPVSATWSTGDGGTEECAGPGVVWRRGLDDDDTYCSYVYRRSSAGEPDDRYQLQVTVAFEVTWSSNVGQGGSLEGLSRSSFRSIRVGEIQAIETE